MGPLDASYTSSSSTMKLLVPLTERRPSLLDGSELLRPEEEYIGKRKSISMDKDEDNFRVYDENCTSEIQERVKKTYYEMHTNQTLEFVQKKMEKWLKFDHVEATVMEALEMLNELVDESDPDIDLPNIIHAFQTAEQIRAKYPDKEWFQLTGLIHDLGKIMAFYDEPQWAVVGDTFPVGCAPQESIVYGKQSFKDNPDLADSRYSTKYGIYEPNCGIDNLMMSWGHDEYLYQVLKNHGATIPEEGLAMIRCHSFYPWHTGGDYEHLTTEKDKEMVKWVNEFNKYDLYTKSSVTPDVEALKPYYQGLIDKFVPGVVKF